MGMAGAPASARSFSSSTESFASASNLSAELSASTWFTSAAFPVEILFSRSSSPPKYLIFFKGRDADALTAAFTEYTGKKVRKAQKTERPSVLAKLSQFKELVKHAVVDRNKRKELER